MKKKSSHRKTAPPDSIAAFDEAIDCCLNIQALAELVVCEGAELYPGAIARAGSMIFTEAEKMQKRLEMLTVGAKR